MAIGMINMGDAVGSFGGFVEDLSNEAMHMLVWPLGGGHSGQCA